MRSRNNIGTGSNPSGDSMRPNGDSGTSVFYQAELGDGSRLEVYFPLDPAAAHPFAVQSLLARIVRAIGDDGQGLPAAPADVVQALSLAVAVRLLTARSGSGIDADAALNMVRAAIDTARNTEATMARRVADIIKGQKIATLRPSDSVRAACKVMAERNIGAVLVTDEDGRLLGIFTERDLLNRVAAPGLDFDKTLLREVMTKRPMSMHSTDSAIVALRRMRDGGYRHLPVVDGGELRGIVSSRDFLGAELRELEAEAAFKSALQDEGFRPGA